MRPHPDRGGRAATARSLAAILALAAAAAAGPAPGRAQERPVAPPVPAPGAVELRPVPAPGLESMEPAVRDQLTEVRRALDAALETVGGRLRPAPGTSSPALAAAYGRLGQLCLLYRLHESADAAFANAEALMPEDFRWPYYRGAVAEEFGRLEAAAAHYTRALALRPDDLPALLHLGRVELDRNRLEAAARHFARALELDGSSAAALHGLGNLAFLAGRYDEAVERLSAALALQGEATAIHYQLALAYRQLGDLDAARRHLELRGEEPARFPDPLIQVLSLLGTGPEARLRRACVLDRVGQAAEAEAELRALAEADPDHPEIARCLGGLLGRLGRFREAADWLGRAVELAPGDEEARFGRAMALMAGGFESEAALGLEESVEALPESLALLHLLARLRAASADPEVRDGERAVALARRAMAAEPSLDHAETLAMALAEAGRAGEAAALQREVVARARAAGRTDLAALEERLASYERGEPVRTPWRNQR